MLARRLGLAALAAAARGARRAAAARRAPTATEATGSQLAIYSSLPLQGPDA